MTVACPECRAANNPRERACDVCGAVLDLACVVCESVNRVGDRWCGACGAPLVAGAAARAVTTDAATDEALRDELRTITVMMADIEGFGAMTARLGRERQTEVMNEVFEHLAQHHIVEAFDGYIDKFLDGDIMALFGAPIAHEDAPERAVRAAVRMHAELARMHEDGTIPAQTPLTMRIGLNTGPVRVGGVGAGGRMEYTAMGDTVNLAARLMTACAWGRSLISTNTHRRVAGSFELEELPPVTVKGKSRPVPIWAVNAERRRAARIDLARSQGLGRLVGRDDLLAAVVAAWESARTGAGQALGLCGEAGIGKSRLVFELRERLPADGATFLEGRCLSYGANLSYLAVRDVLFQLCGLSDADTAEQRQAKVRAVAAELALDAELAPALGFLLGLDFGDEAFNALDPQELRARLHAGFREALAASARRQPLVLFVDDLQWLDADSAELLGDLVTGCGQWPMLVLLAYRPEFAPPWDAPHFVHLDPRRLDLEQTRAVIASLLAAHGLTVDELRIDDSLAQAVYHKSQGNPFFIDQTVTALVERAEQTGRPTIDFRRGRLLITEEELGDLVPDSVEEILLARIDKLPGSARSLLQAASVAIVGRGFRRSALAFVTEDRQVSDDLAVLCQRELIRAQRVDEQDPEYAFEHALGRDVAYNALLRAERRRLHGRMGEYLERRFATSLEAYVDDLAYHYYNSANATQALLYLPRSAARAARSFSNPLAILQYKRALERTGELRAERQDLARTELEVLKGLVGVQALTGDREVLTYGRQRYDVARELGDHEAMIDALYMLARQSAEQGQFEEARAYWDQVLAEYERVGAWDGVRDTEFGIGFMYYTQGQNEAALEHFERGLHIQLEQLPFDPFGQWVAYNNLAAAYEATGRYTDVLAACDRCEALVAQLATDDPMRVRFECYTAGNRGSAERNLGNLTNALASYALTLADAQATGERGVEAEVRCWLGVTLTALGRLREAGEHLDEGLALARETGHGRWEVGCLAGLAEIRRLVGDVDGCTALLDEAAGVLERLGETAGADEVLLTRARLALDRGRETAARGWAERAARSAIEAHRPAVRVEAEIVLARLGTPLAEPLAAAERMGLKPAQARALLVRAGRSERDLTERLADLDAARGLATACGLVEESVAALCLRAELLGGAETAAELARRLAQVEALTGADYVAAVARRWPRGVA